jgi:hypothetical protein
LDKNKIEPTIKLPANFPQSSDRFKSQLLMKVDRGCVLSINAGNHDMFSQFYRMGKKGFDQGGSNSTAAHVSSDVNGMFHGITVTGPWPKIAERSKPQYFTVDCGRCRDHMIVDLEDARQVPFFSIRDDHRARLTWAMQKAQNRSWKNRQSPALKGAKRIAQAFGPG